MIGTKMHSGKWRLVIKEEEWEFESKVDMMSVLSYLTDLKEIYGNLK